MPQMKKWLSKALSILSYAVIFGSAGFFLGVGYYFNSEFGKMRSSLDAETLIHAGTLAELRESDPSKGIRTLETLLDGGVIAIMLPIEMGKQNFNDLPDTSKRAMHAAKIYRTAYPPENKPTNQELIAALNQIPIPDKWTSQCDSALCKLYSQIQKEAATQPATNATSSTR